jgi:ferric-dicitrate binding protein FerR (iron transport regulator)
MKEGDEYLSEEQLEKARRVAYLIAGYINQTLSVAEHDELDEWVSDNDDNMKLFEDLTDENNIFAAEEWIAKLDSKNALQKFKKRTGEKSRAFGMPVKVILSLVVAASLFWLAIVIFKLQQKSNQSELKDIANHSQKDIAPGQSIAILTLANGSKITLDSLKNGKIAMQGNSLVSKSGTGINYSTNDSLDNSLIEYNTLTTPRGGQYHITLSDGTQVWLNAASSIRYPAAFKGNERRVDITGEAYFEVAKNKAMPFKVSIGSLYIEVLGTHFNINSYTDEQVIATTLLEGSIKITNSHCSSMLKPGQQAQIQKNGEIKLVDGINTAETIAWKNGFFSFHETSIEPLMRQASRWYNVDVKYEGKVTDHFNADINRDVSISKLLHLLELTGRVHFQLKDNTIIVKP